VTAPGIAKPAVIFMGNMGRPKAQWDSRYLGMPLEIGDGKLRLPEPQDWTVDVVTGKAIIRN
jgi:hypothetical protein